MILVAYGTRPEHLKIEPLLKYWKSIGFNNWKVVFTLQHFEFCADLEVNWIYKDHILDQRTTLPLENYGYAMNRLDKIVSCVLNQLTDSENLRPLHHQQPNKIKWENVSAILVQGDTASAFASALSGYHRQIPIIHLEAGLRSFDLENPYPEEGYRRMISAIANINLCPTWKNAAILENEKVNGSVHLVGNTVLDNIINKPRAFSNKILVTLHRRESIDEIEEWFKIIEKLAEKYQNYEFILPIHKNPAIYRFKSIFKYVNCVEPLPHDKFIDLLAECKCVISDSGGVIEEASYFGKTIFLCREKTERPEAWQFYVKCPTPAALDFYFNQKIDSIIDNLNYPCPFGDGKASEKITEILIKEGIIEIN